MKVYQRRIEVGQDAIDENRHVNNVVYVKWMQEIAYAHSCAVGWDIHALDAIGARWVIRSHSIKYLNASVLGDVLIARTWVGKLGRINSIRCYAFTRETDGKTVANGETDWVFVDNRKMRPRRIDPAVAESFAELSEEELKTL